MNLPICKHTEIVCGYKHSLSGVPARCLTKCTLYEPKPHTNADVVEVVRCKDCRYCVHVDDFNMACCSWRRSVTQEFYCADGEKWED